MAAWLRDIVLKRLDEHVSAPVFDTYLCLGGPFGVQTPGRSITLIFKPFCVTIVWYATARV